MHVAIPDCKTVRIFVIVLRTRDSNERSGGGGGWGWGSIQKLGERAQTTALSRPTIIFCLCKMESFSSVKL